jgi:hypothetical protein
MLRGRGAGRRGSGVLSEGVIGVEGLEGKVVELVLLRRRAKRGKVQSRREFH